MPFQKHEKIESSVNLAKIEIMNFFQAQITSSFVSKFLISRKNSNSPNSVVCAVQALR